MTPSPQLLGLIMRMVRSQAATLFKIAAIESFPLAHLHPAALNVGFKGGKSTYSVSNVSPFVKVAYHIIFTSTCAISPGPVLLTISMSNSKHSPLPCFYRVNRCRKWAANGNIKNDIEASILLHESSEILE